MDILRGHWKLHRIIILLILLVSIILLVPQDTIKRYDLVSQEHTILLPAVFQDLCKYTERSNIAWMSFVQEDLGRLCASGYYHSNWWVQFDAYIARGGIPILWCEWREEYDVLGFLYSSPVLVMNEPGRPDQCNKSPTAMAEIFRDYEIRFPLAKRIGPQFISLNVIQPFIDRYEELYGQKPQPYRWAMHYYQRTHDSPQEKLDEFCGILESNGYVCENIWITEFGHCPDDDDNGEAEQAMYEVTRFFIDDPRVEKLFVFTNRNWECLELIDDNNEVTADGRGWLRAVTE